MQETSRLCINKTYVSCLNNNKKRKRTSSVRTTNIVLEIIGTKIDLEKVKLLKFDPS